MAINWSAILQNALSGASTGATAGSLIPGVGTAIGAGVGALTGGTAGYLTPKQKIAKMKGNKNQLQGNTLDQQGDWLWGSQGQQFQFPLRYPWQEQGMQQLLQQGLQNADFDQITNDALKRFNTETVPGLAERFTALGGGAGNQRSGAFANAVGRGGADLEERLGALRAQYGLAQSQMGLQPSFENVYLPGREGAAGQLTGQGLEAAVKSFPQLLDFIKWLSSGNQMNPRQQNMAQGYQPLKAPTPAAPLKPYTALPKLGGL